jgi:hypothetical protein
VRRLLLVEADVENRVEAVVAGKHAAELSLLDADRMRLLPASVEDAGDHAFAPQATGIAGSPALALAHGQLYSLAGHGGEV